MKKVITYSRVSTDEQADGCSLDYQESCMRAYCANHDYTIVKSYKEQHSAKSHKLDRPEFKAMYQYCQSHRNEVDMILFLRWDRFARNLEFACTYKRKFVDELKIEINTVESQIDFNGAEWATLLGLHCGVAHTEDIKISKRTKDGIHGTLEKGKWSNKAPRGYLNLRHSKHDTEIVIDEKWAPIITQAFAEVAKGLECPCTIRRKICPNIPENSFLEMLRNVFYIGKIKVPAYNGVAEHIVDGMHQAIVDEDTFSHVQDVLDGNKRNYPKVTKSVHPDLYLRKIVRCKTCGHAITGSFSKGNGGKYAYYNCSHNGKHLRIKAETMNNMFTNYVGSLVPNKAVLNLYEEVLSDIRSEEVSVQRKELDDIAKEIKRIEGMRDNADDMFCAGKIDAETHDRTTKRYKQSLADMHTKAQLLSQLIDGKIQPKLEYSISLLESMSKYIDDAPVETKLKLIGSMFPEKIEFDGKNYRTDTYNKVLNLIYLETNTLRGEKTKKAGKSFDSPASVPPSEIFTNQFLDDLEKIWELRHHIPDPTQPLLPPNLV